MEYKKVTDMKDIFFGCSSLCNIPDISKLDINNVKNKQYIIDNSSFSLSSFKNNLNEKIEKGKPDTNESHISNSDIENKEPKKYLDFLEIKQNDFYILDKNILNYYENFYQE